MPDLSINVGTEHSTLEHSNVNINTGQEVEQLKLQARELEQFVFGDEKLGIVGIRQQLQGQRFWILFNVALTALLIAYEIFRLA